MVKRWPPPPTANSDPNNRSSTALGDLGSYSVFTFFDQSFLIRLSPSRINFGYPPRSRLFTLNVPLRFLVRQRRVKSSVYFLDHRHY